MEINTSNFNVLTITKICHIVFALADPLTLMRPKQHRAQAPDVPDLAQTVKPWSDLFKIFRNVFAGA